MPERCDPYIYYTRVRPFIFGWHGNPSLPGGLVYQTHDAPIALQLRGETGAQSSIVPAIDALCGVTHGQNDLSTHLAELRAYMPREHREFIAFLESGPRVRSVLDEIGEHQAECADAYNGIIDGLGAFRQKH